MRKVCRVAIHRVMAKLTQKQQHRLASRTLTSPDAIRRNTTKATDSLLCCGKLLQDQSHQQTSVVIGLHGWRPSQTLQRGHLTRRR